MPMKRRTEIEKESMYNKTESVDRKSEGQEND
jgi:hypothetical protein